MDKRFLVHIDCNVEEFLIVHMHTLIFCHSYFLLVSIFQMKQELKIYKQQKLLHVIESLFYNEYKLDSQIKRKRSIYYN